MASNDAFYQAFVEIVPEGTKLRKETAKLFDDVGDDGGRRAGKGMRNGILDGVSGLAAPLATAVAALGVGKIFSDAITNASDLAEGSTAITAVFGDADKTIQTFAANAAQSLGQSTNMTLDAARVFGTFGKAAGLGGEDLAAFSTDFLTLSADLASFNNTTPEQAIEALGAGLRGESEPLRQYGVLLDDAALKARATELGIYSGTGALTQQQKVLAAQAEILAQTSTQQGDFAKTSGGLANQQRILAAGLENVSTSFGALLLPAMLAIVGAINTAVIPALQFVVDGVGTVKNAFNGDPPTVAMGAWTEPLTTFGADLRTLTGFVSGVIGTVRASFLDEPPTMALGAWTEPVTTFGATLRAIFDSVGPILSGIGSVLGPFFSTLREAFGPLIPQLIEFASSFSIVGIAFQAIGPLLPELVAAFGGLATMMAGALGGALTTLMPAVQSLSTILISVLGQVITALLPVITSLVAVIGPLLTTVLNAIMPIIVLVAGVIGQLLTAVAPLVTAILALVAPLVQLVASILGPLIELFTAILTPILSLVSTLVGFLIPVIQFLVTVLTAVIGVIVAIIQWFVDLVTGAGTAGDDLLAFFTGLPDMILGALGNLGSFLVDAGKDLIQGFIDGISSMIGGIGDAVGGVMDFVGGFFPHSPAKRGPFSGSGWKAIKDAGIAIGDQFGAGLDATSPEFAPDLGTVIQAPTSPKLDDSVYGSSAAATRGGAAGVQVTQENHYADGLSESDVARLNAEKLTYALRGI